MKRLIPSSKSHSETTLMDAIEAYADTRKTIDRVLRGLDGALGDLLFGITNEREKAAITRLCYEHTGHTSAKETWSFAPWEEAWLNAELPKPPARLLVCGCGWGREIYMLRELGYEVHGFDPARLNGACPNSNDIIDADYQDFISTVLDGADSPLKQNLHPQYDAILFGWGSLTHVTESAQRKRVFEAAHRIVPAGPILGSAWLRSEKGIVKRGETRRRLLSAARLIAQLRGHTANPEDQFVFGPDFGFGVYIEEAEIKALASQLDRDVEITSVPCGHFTLVPSKNRRRKKRAKLD